MKARREGSSGQKKLGVEGACWHVRTSLVSTCHLLASVSDFLSVLPAQNLTGPAFHQWEATSDRTNGKGVQ